MDRSFRPRAGRLGTHPFYLQGGRDQAATPFAVNGTTTVILGGPCFKGVISKVGHVAGTLPADADGTFVATLKKRNGATVTTLSAALDLESTMTANVQSYFTLLTTLTDAQKTVDGEAGDILYVEIVNNSAAVDTQPVGYRVTAELHALT